MATASENARKVLNSIKAKLNLDKFPLNHFAQLCTVPNCASDFLLQRPALFLCSKEL